MEEKKGVQVLLICLSLTMQMHLQIKVIAWLFSISD
jgi:hypothetical protein